MRKNKILKFVSVMLMAAMMVSLAGCGDKKDGTASEDIDYSVGLNEDGTLKDINPEDYVKIAEYKNIEIPTADIEVTPEALQEQIDAILAEHPDTVEIKDREVKDGDTVNIDYVGSIDGKEFEGGSTEGKGTNVTIGQTQYIDDFLEQLIGHKPGETFDVEVTFPKDYGQEDLNGKDAVFKTTVNYIAESKTPELTDAFVAEKLQADYGYTSVADMKAKMTEDMKAANTENYIYEYLMGNFKFKELPKDAVEQQLDLRVQVMKMQMQYSGISMDDYLKTYGFKNEEEYRESLREDCEDMVKMYMVCQIIFEKEGLKVTDEDLKEIFGQDDISKMKEYYGKGYTNRIGMNNAVLDYLLENCVAE